MNNVILVNGTTEEFIKTANRLRKENKDSWFVLQGNLGARTVAIKNYNTYLQILRIDGVDYASGCMEMPVKAWLAELQSGFQQSIMVTA